MKWEEEENENETPICIAGIDRRVHQMNKKGSEKSTKVGNWFQEEKGNIYDEYKCRPLNTYWSTQLKVDFKSVGFKSFVQQLFCKLPYAQCTPLDMYVTWLSDRQAGRQAGRRNKELNHSASPVSERFCYVNNYQQCRLVGTWRIHFTVMEQYR